jgi:hypothetical protein
MSNVTLILTRVPVQEFNYGKRSGRWGVMAIFKGARISAAKFLSVAPVGAYGAGTTLGGRALEITADGEVECVAEFDTMERFRTDSNRKQFYMQVRPRPNQPYMLTMFRSSTVAQLNKSGECLRVHGHGYKQQGSSIDAGILVHEAPHVGWLIGCISPRFKNKREQSSNREPSRQAMEFIFEQMGGFAIGKKADLLVLDW